MPSHSQDSRANRVPMTEAVIERAAGMLHAAGDPARLRILELLLSGEHQVSEIAGITEAEMSTTSQRLRVLLKEDLVARRRDGRDMFYRLVDAHVETLIRNVLDHADPDSQHD
ncbi:MAG: metalloregulator ArsR/SmtB family transcription factor [Woeseiaceae bacterium]|nr:metalloregulator ArsR/SmtB family transcription factor [Woeseiaceae bacterium]